ncbi:MULTISPECIES: DUF4845 domain-containing protein [unclassified Lysobacter]|uniref:DUF4845 domain-containing protein n=1 Tax=unclassified Lysobacter TaxID=2635362 RepID=UPI00070F7BD2|nr:MULTISPECIES: DUF4845 domain-containing protein [unclassified Lysobacter]KRD39216.1 hypothetical protein ASE35_02265 [Lysobacter sp. Root916]SFK75595.1 protein of unknown function [Lysobacter sp. cf310]
MKRNQSGMTLIGFIIVLAVVGVFVYMGMKLIPMYTEYYGVKRALTSLAAEPGIADRDPAKIEDLFFRRLYVSYADNVKHEHVKIQRKGSGYEILVNYEVRRQLIANLDVVGRFEAHQDIVRGGGGAD